MEKFIGAQGSHLEVSRNFEPDMREQIIKSRNNYSVNLRVVDNKLVAKFHYSPDKDSNDYEKTFTNLEDFETHLNKFLGIKE